jgi:uncharacterized protein
MKVYVGNFKLKKGYSLEVDITKEIPSFDFQGDMIKFDGNFALWGILENLKDILYFKGEVQFKIILNCHRCLEPFKLELKSTIEQEFKEGKKIEDDEAIYFTGEYIDFEPIVMAAIIEGIPMKKVCSQMCKGICSNCGNSLNTKECSCSNEDINPKLEILKKLLTE